MALLFDDLAAAEGAKISPSVREHGRGSRRFVALPRLPLRIRNASYRALGWSTRQWRLPASSPDPANASER
jgi:hypothetical protein